jgi:hypothetical protein
VASYQILAEFMVVNKSEIVFDKLAITVKTGISA